MARERLGNLRPADRPLGRLDSKESRPRVQGVAAAVSSSLRRGALAASVIAFSIASLAACGAGNNSQTLEIKPDNAATSVGAIKVQNATIITQPDPQATGPAVVSATIFNGGATNQTLQSVTIAGTSQPLKLSPAKGQSLTVPAHGSLILGGK